MRRGTALAAAAAAAAIAALAAVGVSAAVGNDGHGHGTAGGCVLGGHNGRIQHVIYLQFDNTHYRRDIATSRRTSSRCRTS